MKGKVLKRTIAAVMALVIVGGAVPLTGGSLLPFTPLTASADSEASVEESLSFDEITGKLTLRGEFSRNDFSYFMNNIKKNVYEVYAEKGTVLPTDCGSLFQDFTNVLRIDLSNADTSNVTNMSMMFRGCEKVNTIDLSTIDTSNVNTMYCMFNGCERLISLDISSFDTKKVTNMRSMFEECINIQELDLSSFDTLNVSNMYYMFNGCKSLTTIYASADWTILEGTNTTLMFEWCKNLVGGAGSDYYGLHNSGVSTEEMLRIDGGKKKPGLFTYKQKKSEDYSYFNENEKTLYLKGKVNKDEIEKRFIRDSEQNAKIKHIVAEDKCVLPAYCQWLLSQFSAVETIDLDKADTRGVTNIHGMFNNCPNLKWVNLGSFNVSKVTDMSIAFGNCSNLEAIYYDSPVSFADLAPANVQSDGMFYGCTSLSGGAGTAFSSSATDISRARTDSAEHQGYFTHDLCQCDYPSLILCGNVSKATLTRYKDNSYIKKIVAGDNLTLANNCGYLFKNFTGVKEIDLSNLECNNVTNMDQMFAYCTSLKTLDISGFDLSVVEYANSAFAECRNLETITVSSDFGRANMTYIKSGEDAGMFANCSSLVGGAGTSYNENYTSAYYARIDGGTSSPGYFTYKKDFKSLPFDETTGTLTLTGAIKKAQLYEYRTNTSVKKIIADYTAVLPQNCAGLFDGLSAECIDLSNVDTKNVTDMSQMFFNCSSLKAIFVSDKWVTAPSTSRMFLGCESLVGGNGSKYDSTQTNGVYARIDKHGQKGYFSQHCTALDSYGNLILKGYINRYELDSYRGSGKGITAIRFRYDAVLPENCSGLFKDFADAQTIVISGTNNAGNVTKYVKNMSEMFSGCTNAYYIAMIDCDTSSVTDMSDMFYNCKAMTGLDISSLDTGNVTDMSGMFSSCKQLTELDLGSFDTRNVTNMAMMFTSCSALKTITVGELWSLESERNSTNMFRGCTNLVGGIGTKFSTSHTNSLYARVDTVSEPGYLTANYPVVISNSMTLGGSISLNFYVAPSGLTEANLPKTYVVFDVNGKQQKVNIDLNKMNGKKTGYGFNCKLNSISMADDVKATIHYFDANGVEKTCTKTATCEQYLRKFNEQLDGGTKSWELIKGINDYGYYMQKYLSSLKTTNWVLGVDHKPMELAFRDHAYYNSNKAEYIKEIKDQAKSFGTNKNIEKVNYSLVLDSDTAINFKIKKKEGYTGKFTVTVDGKSVTPKKLTDGRFQVTVAGIAAHKLNEVHTVKVTTDSGTTTYKASAVSFLYECISKPNSDLEFDAMCAMYEYYKAAVAFKA